MAEQARSAKAVNIVMMGVLSGLMDFDAEVWRRAIRNLLPEKLHALNLRAFELGREQIKQENVYG